MDQEHHLLLQRFSQLSDKLAAFVACNKNEEISAWATDINKRRDYLLHAYQKKAVDSRVLADTAIQLNHLSLNLAIESSRLGEDGREGVLIAEELRKIAEELRGCKQKESATKPDKKQGFIQKIKGIIAKGS